MRQNDFSPARASSRFSNTVRKSNTVGFWNLRPMPAWAISGSFIVSRLIWFPKNTRPASGRVLPVTTSIIVVLPAPFGPITQSSSPGVDVQGEVVEGLEAVEAHRHLLQVEDVAGQHRRLPPRRRLAFPAPGVAPVRGRAGVTGPGVGAPGVGGHASRLRTGSRPASPRGKEQGGPDEHRAERVQPHVGAFPAPGVAPVRGRAGVTGPGVGAPGVGGHASRLRTGSRPASPRGRNRVAPTNIAPSAYSHTSGSAPVNQVFA